MNEIEVSAEARRSSLVGQVKPKQIRTQTLLISPAYELLPSYYYYLDSLCINQSPLIRVVHLRRFAGQTLKFN